MSPKVALAGASGNLGPAVLNALLDAGFQVTVLTRAGKDSKFDSRAHVAPVDFTSLESLTSALAGNDVVVNTLGSGAIPLDTHTRLIDAAVAAGIQRFIPSEFGSDTTNPNVAKLPVYGDKVAVQKYLQQKSESSGGKFSFTLLITGAFFDWGLMTTFLLNLKGPEAEVYDSGDQKFSTTTLAGVGKGVAGVIQNLDATKNKTVFIREAEVSQNQLLKIANKHLAIKSVKTEDLEKNAYAELSKPSPNPMVFAVSFIRRAIFGDGYGGLFPEENVYNKLLGVKELSDEEIEDVVSRYSN
ncbi:hypothetical protein ASPWEDRAFT_139325 [Aspergillus wentii DTO 134E9]|uniref:NmrA-like domain-containing protein n=1 Tax=Aspergillus wentii DTO 134E9 TaxID=1073089 RepID=A0A1L9RAJ9_ASPWE|nr:uncharacterized protein ASPWEDRAFT_139325 [Aspergillus wentii DTO 134E9]OJJ31955.1 hypothetical protein ASPWEDRAFT_139325 [Aspergillus wentii DTO 134E9]